MKKVALTLSGVVLVTIAALALTTTALAASDNSTIHIKNKSDWEIHHFFLSPTDEDHWGADQLGDKVIATGGTFDLHKVPCDSYDIKLVDEDGDECVIGGVDICASKEGWVITNDELLDCESESEGD